GAPLKPERHQSSLLKSGNTGGRDETLSAMADPPFSPRPNECEAVITGKGQGMQAQSPRPGLDLAQLTAAPRAPHSWPDTQGDGPMGKVNAEWHNAHKMPTNPTEQQRAEWHYFHAINC